MKSNGERKQSYSSGFGWWMSGNVRSCNISQGWVGIWYFESVGIGSAYLYQCADGLGWTDTVLGSSSCHHSTDTSSPSLLPPWL